VAPAPPTHLGPGGVAEVAVHNRRPVRLVGHVLARVGQVRLAKRRAAESFTYRLVYSGRRITNEYRMNESPARRDKASHL
jgi:hypothetical protein